MRYMEPVSATPHAFCAAAGEAVAVEARLTVVSVASASAAVHPLNQVDVAAPSQRICHNKQTNIAPSWQRNHSAMQVN